MPSIIDLGRSVKSKYPEYQNMPDEEVGRRVKQKYPDAYGSYEDITAQKQVEKQGSGGFGGFLKGALKGAQSTVANLGTLAQKGLDTIAKPIVQTITRKPYKSTQTLNEALGDKLKPQGTAEKIGFGTEQVGEFLLPGGAATKVGKVAEAGLGASKLAKVARVGTTALTEAGITAGQTTTQGGSTKDAKNAAIIGGAFSTATQGIKKILQELPTNAWRSILSRTSKEVAKNPNLPASAAMAGLVGTQKSIVKQAQRNIQHLELSLDDILKTKTGIIDGEKVATYLNAVKQTYKQIPGEGYAVNVLKTLQQEMRDKGMLTLNDANKLKRSITKLVEDSYGKGTLEIPGKVEGQRLLASGLRQEIEKAVPEVKQLNHQQGMYIQIRDAIERQLSQGEGKGINIAGIHLGGYDILTGVAGAVGGGPSTAGGLVFLKKASQAAITQSTAAKLANYFNNLSPTKKALFYNALKGSTIEAATTD